MEKLDTKDGYSFIKGLEDYVRRHEPEIANCREQSRRFSQCSFSGSRDPTVSRARSSSTLAAALSLASFSFASTDSKQAVVTLTPNHAFYLLSRFEELDVDVGPMNIRLENINTEQSSAYVSFLSKPRRYQTGDKPVLRSVSSVHRAMSAMGSYFSSFRLSSRGLEKAKSEREALTYLYSSFTKIPSLKLVSDSTIPLIHGYEEYPFDTAVPLYAFHNLRTLEVTDTDFRSFYGWDRLAERLTNLTLNRVNIDDLDDLLTGIVLDDFDRRRRRSTKTKSPPSKHSILSTNMHNRKLSSMKTMPVGRSPAGPDTQSCHMPSPTGGYTLRKATSESVTYSADCRDSSSSPHRSNTSHKHSLGHRHRGNSYHKMKRSRSGSSQCSDYSRRGSITNLMVNVDGVLVPKWQRLSYLNLADNSLSSVRAAALAPVADSLMSFDLSHNKFTAIPESLSCLTHLRSLNLSYCQISSLDSLHTTYPLPAITTLRLRGNPISCISGIECLTSLERLDLRDNNITDPKELACLTTLPRLREIWIHGNPFTKTHPNHRITIFNMFRRTSGFMHDIIIDKVEPRYHERKSLADRVGDTPTNSLSQSVGSDMSSMLHMASKMPLPSSEGQMPAPAAGRESPTVEFQPIVKRKPNFVNLHDQDHASSRQETESIPNVSIQPPQHYTNPAPEICCATDCEDSPTTESNPVAPMDSTNTAPKPDNFSSDIVTEPPTHASLLPQMTLRCPEPTSPASYYGPCPSESSNNGASGPSTTITTPIDSPAANEMIPSFNEIHWNISDKPAYRKQLAPLAPDIDEGWTSMLKSEDWIARREDMNIIAMPRSVGPPVM